MANSPPKIKPLKPGSNFSLRLPQDIDPELLAELNKHKRSKNFNAYAVSMLLGAVRGSLSGKSSMESRSVPAEVSGVTDRDLESAVERTLAKLLAGRILPLSEPVLDKLTDGNTKRIDAHETAPPRVQDQVTETHRSEPVDQPKSESDASNKDSTKRRKNRMMGRDVLRASENFGGGEG